MSLSTLVSKQVLSAFKLLGDLADTAVFTQSAPSEFDFSTGAAVPSAETALTVRGVYEASKRTVGDSLEGAETAKFMFPARNAPELENLNKVSLRGKTWRVISPIEKNAFLIIVSLVRES